MQTIPREHMEEFHKAWEDLLGQVPEERQPGDLTAQEIVDTWKIDRNQVYQMAKSGKLVKVKVVDPENLTRSIVVYRIPK